jgi:hypothetical protein
MSELVKEYLRRIHQAGGVPTEQAIDTAAQPRTGPSIASRAAVCAAVHLTTGLSREGEM